MVEFRPYATYSEQADAAYVHLAEGQVATTESLDDLRMIDYSGDGRVIGIELLDVSDGVDLRDIPQRPLVEALLHDYNFPVLA